MAKTTRHDDVIQDKINQRLEMVAKLQAEIDDMRSKHSVGKRSYETPQRQEPAPPREDVVFHHKPEVRQDQSDLQATIDRKRADLARK